MEVSVEVHKIIKRAIYSIVFSFRWRCLWSVGEIVVNQKHYQGCQFDVDCSQCQTSRGILGIKNDFVQYIQNYFQYVYIHI